MSTIPLIGVIEPVTLIAKYIGVKKIRDSINTNSSSFSSLFPEGDTKEILSELDASLQEMLQELDGILEEHKDLLLKRTGPLMLPGGEMSDIFVKMYLLIVFINGGYIPDTLSYAKDAFSIADPSLSLKDSIDKATDFAKDMVLRGYIKPLIETSSDVEELLQETSQDPSALRMCLSEEARNMIKEELDWILMKRGFMKVTSSEESPYDLMNMEPISKTLN